MTVTGATNYVTNYTYDANNRLKTEIKTIGDVKLPTEYTYDQNGNQLTKTSYKLSNASSNPSLTNISVSNKSLSSAQSSFESNIIEFNTFDAFNRLIKTENNTTGLATYKYKPDDLRLSKRANNQTTTHIWDGSNIVTELNDTSAVTNKYIRGINLIKNQNNEYFIYNAHGDVVQLTNNTGTSTKTYNYDSFGVESAINDNDTNPFRYCGEYYDKETGSYYLRARYYNPKNGRFSSEDPIRDGLNWYTYCGGNPIAFVDPSGLVYIIAWSYGGDDVLAFEEDCLNLDEPDKDTSDWGDAEWKEFDKRNAFSRAAMNQYKMLRSLGVPKKEIILRKIDSAESLKNAWEEWAEFNEVDQLYFFSHGTEDGPEVRGGSEGFWKNAKKLNWSSSNKTWEKMVGPDHLNFYTLSPSAYFYGCNTANGTFAQNFADTQGVVTYAQTDYTNFSRDPIILIPINPWSTSTSVYLRTFDSISNRAYINKIHLNKIGAGKKFIPNN